MQRESPDFKEEQAKKSRLRRKKRSTPRRSWLEKNDRRSPCPCRRNRLPQVRIKLAGNDSKNRCPADSPQRPKNSHSSPFGFSLFQDRFDQRHRSCPAKRFGAQAEPHDNHGGLHYRLSSLRRTRTILRTASQTHPPSVDLCLLGNHDGGPWTKKRGGYKS